MRKLTSGGAPGAICGRGSARALGDVAISTIRPDSATKCTSFTMRDCSVVIVAVSFSVMFVNASNRSEAFCAEIVVGAPVEGLEARAHELGLRVISHPAEGAQPGQIVAFGLAPYWPRCVVEHVNGKVVGKRAFSTAFIPLPEAGSHHVQL